MQLRNMVRQMAGGRVQIGGLKGSDWEEQVYNAVRGIGKSNDAELGGAKGENWEV